ncbi:SAM-dependent methyltransferase [Amycolatopsis sp. NPDC049868]|uniref:SAM-dependent methyltransferase n=1 Tax=Amycolatopsis sp. NPDC049868 TaxID=3363934 RepID=UPI0037A51AAB
MIPATGPRRNAQVPYWGDTCPRPLGCCKGLHTPGHRAYYQKYWGYVPARCGQRPHPARVDDALRNGTLASPKDRQLARELMHISPAAAVAIKERDSFTTRVVEDALAEGITQFLDLGRGFISHSASYAALAGARGAGGTPSLVLVDNDANVHDHNRGCLGQATHLERPFATAVRGNAFAVDTMLNDLRDTQLVDLDRPVCVLLVDLLHYLERRRSPLTVIRRLTTRLPHGSWIAITHLTNQPLLPDIPPPARAALRDDTARWCRAHERCVPPHPRSCSPSTFADWMADLELLPPGGITSQACWPEPDTTHGPHPHFTLAAVGRVPSASPRRPRSPRTARRAAARDMLAGVIADSDVPFEEFAVSADQSPAQLRRVLNGHGRISPDLAYAAARRYGIDPHALLTLQDHAELATITARREHTATTSDSPPVAGQHTLDVDDSDSAVDVLHALIAATGLSRHAFAETLGYDRSTLTKTLSGRHYVTASLALGLAHRYGIDAADLLARQARHQIAVAAERAQPTEAPPS